MLPYTNISKVLGRFFFLLICIQKKKFQQQQQKPKSTKINSKSRHKLAEVKSLKVIGFEITTKKIVYKPRTG